MSKRWKFADILVWFGYGLLVIGVVILEVMLLAILFGSELSWPLPGKLAVAAAGHGVIGILAVAAGEDMK